MNRQEQIQALKDNEKPFILLTVVQKDFIRKTPLAKFVFLQEPDAKEGNVVWDNPCSDRFYNEEDSSPFGVIRLRPDYEEEPEIERCEVYVAKVHGPDLLRYDRFGVNLGICGAVDFLDFIGYEYEDGYIDTSPRIYREKEEPYSAETTIEDLGSIAKYEVLTPTHVLFRRQK